VNEVKILKSAMTVLAIIAHAGCGESDNPSPTREPDIGATPSVLDIRMSELPAPKGFELTYADRPEEPFPSAEDNFKVAFEKERGALIEIRAVLYAREADAMAVVETDSEDSDWGTPSGVILGDEAIASRVTIGTFVVVFRRSNFVVFGTAHEPFVDGAPQSLESQTYTLLKEVDSRIIEAIHQ
jgi:hypothetical protein